MVVSSQNTRIRGMLKEFAVVLEMCSNYVLQSIRRWRTGGSLYIAITSRVSTIRTAVKPNLIKEQNRP
jgi:hypothetical protein